MNKIPTLIVPLLALSLAAPSAFAASISLDATANTAVSVERDNRGNEVRTDSRGSADMRVEERKYDRKDHSSTTASTTHKRMNGEEHRSAVAQFVQSLRGVADRDAGIGARVRAVAQRQNDHASTTADAMVKIEHRNKVSAFLFGHDWKSLDWLKEAVVEIKADIVELSELLDEATDASVRADLQAQIEVLEDRQADLEAFIEVREESFSLFGWATRMFGKEK